MKVLVFGMTENPGGIESVIMNYYRKLDREKIHFDFLCNCKNIAYEAEIRALGGSIYSITARSVDPMAFRRELKQFMDSHGREYDVLWVNVCNLVNIDYLVAAKKAGIRRVIIHCHNPADGFGPAKRLLHAVNRHRLHRYATDFWSCDEAASPWFYTERIMNTGCCRVIPNAIDTDRFAYDETVRRAVRQKLGLEDCRVIGHVGRFEDQKNHAFLIPVLEKLVQRDKSVRLMLVGQGSLEDAFRAQVREKGLEPYVVYCGVDPQVERFYQAMDVFVLPSLFEGLGIVALEAQANGLPCVLSDTVPAVVKHNGNVAFLPLEQGAADWAQQTVAAYDRGRVCTADNLILNSEFDIRKQTANFERWITEEGRKWA